MTLTRRTMLKGLLGGAVVTIGLPPLELFMNGNGTAYAADGTGGFPKRFGLFFWGNGMLPERWIPTGEGAEWELSDQLMPLSAFKDKLTVVTGMRVPIPNVEPHHATAAGMLTGRPLLMANGGYTFAGPSIDQIVAEGIGDETLYRSIEAGTKPSAGMSHNGPHSVNPPETSPFALFQRIFGGSFQLPGDEVVIDPTLALRRSVLDAVMDDIARVQDIVGQADRVRLEQHLEGVRALERRLARLEEDPPNLAACAYPPTPEEDYPDIEGRPQLQEKNAIFSQIFAMSLACDQTRVFTNEFTKPLVNCLFEGATAGHHQLTHDEPGEQPEVHEITLQCITAMAAQLEALDAIQEGDGTLLDHCLIFGTSDVSSGKIHSATEFPILLAGGGGGAVKTGMHYRGPANENTSKVLMTITRAMGMNLPSIGEDDGYTEDGLDDIEV